MELRVEKEGPGLSLNMMSVLLLFYLYYFIVIVGFAKNKAKSLTYQ